MSDWPFCDPATAPIRNTQDTSVTVCAGASSTLETGAFLDAKLVVRGPSSSTPVLSAQQSSEGGGGAGGDVHEAGLEYDMSGESAEASLIMSEWVKTDSNGWTKVGVQLGSAAETLAVCVPVVKPAYSLMGSCGAVGCCLLLLVLGAAGTWLVGGYGRSYGSVRQCASSMDPPW